MGDPEREESDFLASDADHALSYQHLIWLLDPAVHRGRLDAEQIEKLCDPILDKYEHALNIVVFDVEALELDLSSPSDAQVFLSMVVSTIKNYFVEGKSMVILPVNGGHTILHAATLAQVVKSETEADVVVLGSDDPVGHMATPGNLFDFVVSGEYDSEALLAILEGGARGSYVMRKHGA